uniref:Uncharacterized protein n=1 Tax=Oryza punctata TaxID=4537 RepID=A0A0E0LR76_ORYPU
MRLVTATIQEPSSYALVSSLAVFTSYGAFASTAADNGNEQSPAPPRARKTTPWQTPATLSPQRAGDGRWEAI